APAALVRPAVSLWALSPRRRRMLAASTLAGLLAGSAAGLASGSLPGPLGSLWAPIILYLAGLAATLAASARHGASVAVEGAVAYTALFLGLWVSVYNLVLP
ncbi:MAG: hypothetical protein GSR80_001289, partial [Desulfurococcales archaeon]|nr:hypothetical protein [Desulfurococcales archaeon]